MNKQPFLQRLKSGIDALLSGSAPATGEEISDIACYLDVEKNRHNPEIRKVMADAVDKLHTAAAALMIEERAQ